MKTTLIKTILSLFIFALVVGCQREEVQNEPTQTAPSNVRMAATPNLPATPFSYANITLPAYLNTPQIRNQINTPANNPITDQGAALGRVLFYDKSLSANNTVACASCHQQNHAFSDPARFSRGFAGGLTTRNSMSLVNARYYANGRFFWDERASSLEVQASMPIVHPVEMGLTMTQAVAKLRTLDYLPRFVSKCFPKSHDRLGACREGVGTIYPLDGVVPHQI
jgi:cytochrome c peroxidase